MHAEQNRTVSIARAEAARMQAAIAGTEKDARVSMTSDQFAVLSRLITVLCDIVTGPPGTMGDPKYWVPLDIFVKVRDLATRLQSECEHLRVEGHSEFTLLPGHIDRH